MINDTAAMENCLIPQIPGTFLQQKAEGSYQAMNRRDKETLLLNRSKVSVL
jgi:hypothetical protein